MMHTVESHARPSDRTWLSKALSVTVRLAAIAALVVALIGCGDLIDQHDIATHPAVIGHVTSLWFASPKRSKVLWARIDFQPDPGSPGACSGSVRVPTGAPFMLGQAVSVVPHANGCRPVLVDYVGRGGVKLVVAAGLAALAIGCVVLERRRWRTTQSHSRGRASC